MTTNENYLAVMNMSLDKLGDYSALGNFIGGLLKDENVQHIKIGPEINSEGHPIQGLEREIYGVGIFVRENDLAPGLSEKTTPYNFVNGGPLTYDEAIAIEPHFDKKLESALNRLFKESQQPALDITSRFEDVSDAYRLAS
ncbi:hypothetical protein HOI26_04250 [Candidatus Woesearchaeota archaeon]|nr:hypothetical protein [Candidatus Woesearchaeota archaeon]MBT5740286.1 hypothetical protein [Candidatus Woesearchaeota archaeon]